jgi:hypothetical protein
MTAPFQRKRLQNLLASAVAVLSLAPMSAPIYAQDVEGELIHWAYASFFGTGWYKIGSGSEVFALSVRPRWTWREPELHENGERTLGIEFRLPLTLGVHRFDLDSIPEILDLDNVSTISVVPGIEVEIPMNTRWTLKPLGYLGWGGEVDGDSSAWIYWGGVKSRVSFDSGELDWALVNSLLYVGYSADGPTSGKVTPFLTAFEFQRPLRNKRIGGDQLYLNWHVGYTSYLDNLAFRIGPNDVSPVEISDEWDLSVGFSKGPRRLKLWRLEWDRVGLAFRFSSDGDLTGLSLTFRSIFDR